MKSVLDQVRLAIANLAKRSADKICQFSRAERRPVPSNMKYEKGKTKCFAFPGGPGESEGLPEGAEQRASHCCRQKRQVSFNR